MNQFPTADHLASWTGVAPGNYESAGKKSAKIVKGNTHAKVALSEASWAIARSRNTELATKFWKIASRRGKARAFYCHFPRILRLFKDEAHHEWHCDFHRKKIAGCILKSENSYRV